MTSISKENQSFARALFHAEPVIALSLGPNFYDANNQQKTVLELQIDALPPFSQISHLIAYQDIETVWRIAIEYHNHQNYDSFQELCRFSSNPLLSLASLTHDIALVLGSQQSKQHHSNFIDLIHRTSGLLTQSKSLTNSQQRSAHNSVPASLNATLTRLQQPILSILLSILQFVRITQSSVLESDDSSKIKDKLVPIATNTPLESTTINPGDEELLRTPSSRKQLFGLITATLEHIATVHVELLPIANLVLGCLALYDAQYTHALRYFCFALAHNPLLPPSVRLAIGYCYYYKRQFHQAKIAFVRTMNLCLEPSFDESEPPVVNAEHRRVFVDALVALATTEITEIQDKIAETEKEFKILQDSTNLLSPEEYASKLEASYTILKQHATRIVNLLQNILSRHGQQLSQHPILGLYIAQLELSVRLAESQMATSPESSLIFFMKSFRWDPDGSYLQSFVSQISLHNEGANDPAAKLITPKLYLDDIILILQTITYRNIELNNLLASSIKKNAPNAASQSPPPRSALLSPEALSIPRQNPAQQHFPLSLSPALLIRSLVQLGHCYFCIQRFDLAEDCYGLAVYKLNNMLLRPVGQASTASATSSTTIVSTAPTARSLASQRSVQKDLLQANPHFLLEMGQLRTVCHLQIARCLSLCDKLTHGCTAINRALSSLPPEFLTVKSGQTLYVNIEQYLLHIANISQSVSIGMIPPRDGTFIGIGGPQRAANGQPMTLKPYSDLELAINIAYVQIMVSYFAQRKRPYTPAVSQKQSTSTSSSSTTAPASLLGHNISIPRSIPLLSVIAATCLYTYESQNKNISYDIHAASKDSQLAFLLQLSISALVHDLTVCQDTNLLLFGLTCVLRLLGISVEPLFQTFFPTEGSEEDQYMMYARREASILALSQQVQLIIYQMIASKHDTSLDVEIRNDDNAIVSHLLSKQQQQQSGNTQHETIVRTLQPLLTSHQLLSPEMWSNIAVICGILCIHMQQYNTRSLSLQQQQLTSYIHKYKQLINSNISSQLSQTQSREDNDDDDFNGMFGNSDDEDEMEQTNIKQSVFPQPTSVDTIDNPYVSMLLQHLPPHLHSMLTRSPAPLVQMQTSTHVVNIATLINNSSDNNTSLSQQHPTYLSLMTTTQYKTTNKTANALAFQWRDSHFDTISLFNDNLWTLLFIITSATTLAMSLLQVKEQGPFQRVVQQLPTLQTTQIASFSSTLSQDPIVMKSLCHLQFIDNNNGTVMPHLHQLNLATIEEENLSPILYNIHGLVVPLPLPLHAVTLLSSVSLLMRSFVMSFPFDKYNIHAMKPQGNIVNILTYSLHYIRQNNFLQLLTDYTSPQLLDMKTITPSNAASVGGDDGKNVISLQPSNELITTLSQLETTNISHPLVIGTATTLQQASFHTYIELLISSFGFMLTFTGIILQTYGTHLPTRLIRIDALLQLHDVFMMIETIRYKLHFTRHFTYRAIEDYTTFITTTDKVNQQEIIDPETYRNQVIFNHEYYTSQKYCEEYALQFENAHIAAQQQNNNNNNMTTTSSNSVLSRILDQVSTNTATATSLFQYIDWDTDYLGLAVYFGHYATSIISLLRDHVPDRPILIPLPSINASYYNQMASPRSHHEWTLRRYAHSQNAYEIGLVSLRDALPSPYGNRLDLSGFDDLGSILTTHALQCYTDLITRESFSPEVTTLVVQRTGGDAAANAAAAASGTAPAAASSRVVYTGFMHPFYKARLATNKNILSNFIVFNSDCILTAASGSHTILNIENHITSINPPSTGVTTVSFPLQVSPQLRAAKPYFPKPIARAQKLFIKCIHLQLHLTHPHLVCSESALYKTAFLRLYNESPPLHIMNLSWYSAHQDRQGVDIYESIPNDTKENLIHVAGSIVDPAASPEDFSTTELVAAMFRSNTATEHAAGIFPFQFTYFSAGSSPIAANVTARVTTLLQSILSTTSGGSNDAATAAANGLTPSLHSWLYTVAALLKYKESEMYRIASIRFHELSSIEPKRAKAPAATNTGGSTAQPADKNQDALKQLSVSIKQHLSCLHQALAYVHQGFLHEASLVDYIAHNSTPTSSSSSSRKSTSSKDTPQQLSTYFTSPCEESPSYNNTLLLLSVLLTSNLIKQHVNNTGHIGLQLYNEKVITMQSCLRDLKTFLTKYIMSATISQQLVHKTFNQLLSPIDLVLTPSTFRLSLIQSTSNAETMGNNSNLLLQKCSTQSQFSLTIAHTISAFQLLASLNDQITGSHGSDDSIFFAFIAIALNGLHQGLTSYNHPLYFHTTNSRIYNNDFKPYTADQVAENNIIALQEGIVASRNEPQVNDTAMGDGPIDETTSSRQLPNELAILSIATSKRQTAQLSTQVLQSYPIQSFITPIDIRHASYLYLPSITQGDDILLGLLTKLMKKSFISVLPLQAKIHYDTTLQLLHSYHISLQQYDQMIHYQDVSLLPVTSIANQISSVPYQIHAFPLGKFDSLGMTSFDLITKQRIPRTTMHLSQFALQAILSTNFDYVTSATNYAHHLMTFALTMAKFVYFITDQKIVQQGSSRIAPVHHQAQQNLVKLSQDEVTQRFSPPTMFFSIVSALSLLHHPQLAVQGFGFELHPALLAQIVASSHPYRYSYYASYQKSFIAASPETQPEALVQSAVARLFPHSDQHFSHMVSRTIRSTGVPERWETVSTESILNKRHLIEMDEKHNSRFVPTATSLIASDAAFASRVAVLVAHSLYAHIKPLLTSFATNDLAKIEALTKAASLTGFLGNKTILHITPPNNLRIYPQYAQLAGSSLQAWIQPVLFVAAPDRLDVPLYKVTPRSDVPLRSLIHANEMLLTSVAPHLERACESTILSESKKRSDDERRVASMRAYEEEVQERQRAEALRLKKEQEEADKLLTEKAELLQTQYQQQVPIAASSTMIVSDQQAGDVGLAATKRKVRSKTSSSGTSSSKKDKKESKSKKDKKDKKSSRRRNRSHDDSSDDGQQRAVHFSDNEDEYASSGDDSEYESRFSRRSAGTDEPSRRSARNVGISDVFGNNNQGEEEEQQPPVQPIQQQERITKNEPASDSDDELTAFRKQKKLRSLNDQQDEQAVEQVQLEQPPVPALPAEPLASSPIATETSTPVPPAQPKVMIKAKFVDSDDE